MQFFTPLLVALFCLFAPLVHAEKRHSFRVRIVCADDINCGKAIRLFRGATRYISGVLPVDFKVVAFEQVPFVISTGDYSDRLEEWAKRVGKKEDLTYVVVDGYPKAHFIDFPNEEVLGIAESIGGLGQKPVIVMSKMIGADDFTMKIMVHEIGHLLGATHIPFGLMAPSAQENQYTEAYAIETIQQINEYLATLP